MGLHAVAGRPWGQEARLRGRFGALGADEQFLLRIWMMVGQLIMIEY